MPEGDAAPDVRSACENWAGETLEAWLNRVAGADAAVRRLRETLTVMRRDGVDLGKRKGRGELVEGLVRVEEVESFAAPFSFSEVFRGLLKGGSLHPGRYLLEVEERLHRGRAETSGAFSAGFLSRALRAFASFLREVDFVRALEEVLGEEGDAAEVRLTGFVEDLEERADLVVRHGGRWVRVWQYQSTPRGLEQVAVKLSEASRGRIPRGWHLLCPVDARPGGDCADVFGWRLCSSEYAESVREVLRGEGWVAHARLRKDLGSRPEVLAKPLLVRKGWWG